MNDYHALPDEKLAVIVRTTDKEAYAELIRRYEDKLLRYAAYIVGDSNKAADVVQEAFIKAYVNLNGFDAKKKFSSWIYRIVHNEAVNILGKQKRHQPLDHALEYDSGVNLEEDVIKQELIRHTRKCLEHMPIQYREPLSLFYLEDKSYEEISDILRIPIGTVGTRITRAKAMMKTICQQ